MDFWITKKIEKNRRYYTKYSNIAFIILIVLSFSVFSFYSNVSNIIFSKDKVDIFKEDLRQIAFYFRRIDENISKMLLNIDKISQSYLKWENILQTQEIRIIETLEYIKKNQNYLKNLWFKK